MSGKYNLVDPTDSSILAPVSLFSRYSDEIETFISKLLNKQDGTVISKIPDILNGKATESLYDIIPEEIRKKGGIFLRTP
ncbi:MAG: hypothetical protein ABSA18_16610 [Dehalococcoidia bacterium]|jgi:hypothetical protein